MFDVEFRKAKTLLCLGAHSDDIEIGCGGTLMTLPKANPDLEVLWVVLSAEGKRAVEARRSAGCFLQRFARNRVMIRRFRMSYFPSEYARIKDYFEKLKALVDPDLVFTHYRGDLHQDHRVVSDLTWNTFRDHLILEYEVPKYDGDIGQPNIFMPLEEEICRRKAEYICRFFQTQGNKHWFSGDTFRALMRLRGIECASLTKYAEAFYGRKIVIGNPSVAASV